MFSFILIIAAVALIAGFITLVAKMPEQVVITVRRPRGKN